MNSSEPQFTTPWPGPALCRCGHASCRTYTAGPGNFYVGTGFRLPDAHLVGAALRLHNALERILEWADPYALPGCERNERDVEEARAALAQARGEAPA